jgi:hypothetical protein
MENRFELIGNLYLKASEGGNGSAVPNTEAVPAEQLRSGWLAAMFGALVVRPSKITPAATTAPPRVPGCADAFQIGPKVSFLFFEDDHAERGIDRGPFQHGADWMGAELELVLGDQERNLRTATAEDDLQEVKNFQAIIQAGHKLKELIPKVFAREANHTEHTCLMHHDLNLTNILVGDDNKLAAVIDWECVGAEPLWKAWAMPGFLEGQDRHDEPDRDNYGEDDPDCITDQGSDALDDEGITVIYWEHLMEYEQTKLRKVYCNEMEVLCPGLKKIQEANVLQADFECIVSELSDASNYHNIIAWIDDLEKGTPSTYRIVE